jgi:hypothetical protein
MESPGTFFPFAVHHIYIRSDACKYGLGGYKLYLGTTWRSQIPQDLIG